MQKKELSGVTSKMADAKKEERIQEIISKLLDTLSYEELEKKLKDIANYHAISIPNKCQYCGNDSDSPDEDILCGDCASTFGHARYSEL